MIALDTNLLVYAHREDSPDHAAASAVLLDLVHSGRPFGVPWPCLHEFLAVVTHPRIYRPATPQPVAVEAVVALTDLEQVHVLSEGRDHLSLLQELLAGSGVVGPAVHDARIAAICLSHGVDALWSADRDFGRFPRLTVHNPLVGR